jgi:hypothetical protein
MDEVARSCSVSGCGRPVRARGWCGAHYMRWYSRRDIREEVPVADVVSPSPVVIRPGHAEIVMAGGLALVSLADAERVGGERWFVDDRGYVRSSRYGLLHRFVVGARPGEQIDHRNRVRSDCRRENLRRANAQQNAANMAKRPGSSRFKGVSWDRRRGRWVAKIMVDYRSIHLGFFDDETAAAEAYDGAARRYFGEFAATNRSLGLRS